MKQKRLLAILSRYLWPVDGGRKESLNHYFKELHDAYGYEIHILCFMEYGQEICEKDFPPYIADVTLLEDVSVFEKLYNICFKSLGRERWPLQCSLYYSKKNATIIEKKINEWKPDVIFTEMIRTCTYYDSIKDGEALLLANLDDLLSVRYSRQAKSGKSQASFAGSYGNKMPKFLSHVMNEGVIKNTILKMESNRCAKWERTFYKLFDYVLMTSDVERDILNHDMQDTKAKTLSVGIDYEYYSQDIEIEKDPVGLSYLGNFNVAANADTLDMIVNEVLPYIQSEYRFYIIGKCPEEIQNKYRDKKGLIFCGRVEDLREYIKKTTIFLSPIAYGTGIKTKIIEAMAMKMPVVTNSVGAEGICATLGKDFFVFDDMKEVAKAVDELLSDSDMAFNMGEEAGKFVYEHFRWEKVLAVYKEMGL